MPLSTRTVLIAIAFAAALALAWIMAPTLLVIFAGVLVAGVLDGAMRLVHRVLPLPRPILLILVSLVIFGLIAAALVAGGASLFSGLDRLWALVQSQAGRLSEQLQDWGIEIEATRSFTDLFSDPAGMFGRAGSIFGSTLGIAGDVVVAIFLGIFLAIDPAGYRDGFLCLVPKDRRARLREVLDKAGATLRGWLMTQIGMMIVVGTLIFLTFLALGVPNALVLALVAGGLNFIPFLGPMASAIPVFLTLISLDPTTLILGGSVFLLIQNIEGYLVTPLLQERIIALPPAWSLSFMAVMAALFGPLGVALAAPLFAVLRVFVLELYARDVLEGREGPRSVREKAKIL